VGGVRVTELARELEERRFESMWLPEHSHIPCERVPVPPFGENIPEAYFSLVSPLVALGAAAAVTERLVLGTGVCMALEHDVLDLAAAVASLDVIADGRFHFGVGVGWLRQELANHRPELPFEQRYSALVERIAALRCCWQGDEGAFDGRWDRFTASVVDPKPVQQPLPGGWAVQVRWGCGWRPSTPTSGFPSTWRWRCTAVLLLRSVGSAILWRRVDEIAARVPVTMFVWGWEAGSPTRELLEGYCDIGIERLVLLPDTMAPHGRDETLRRLDEFQPFVDATSPSSPR